MYIMNMHIFHHGLPPCQLVLHPPGRALPRGLPCVDLLLPRLPCPCLPLHRSYQVPLEWQKRIKKQSLFPGTRLWLCLRAFPISSHGSFCSGAMASHRCRWWSFIFFDNKKSFQVFFDITCRFPGDAGGVRDRHVHRGSLLHLHLCKDFRRALPPGL